MLTVLSVLISGCRRPDPVERRTRFLMDTVCTIQVPRQPGAGEAIEAAFNRMAVLDVKFNALNPASPIHAFNERNQPIQDPEIVTLVQTACDVARQSGGAFDVTVYPLCEAWGFYTAHPRLPSPDQIRQALADVGWQNLAIRNQELIKLRPGVKIDLGGIAKGYAAGEAAKVLEAHGIRSALIDAGGNIVALGNPIGRKWEVGIRNPRGDGVVGSLGVSDMAVVTSGDYERFFESDGVRYPHILDPRTGYPARELASVTIVHTNSALADALSTATFVLGLNRGLQLVNAYPGTQALLITTNGVRHTTPGFNRFADRL
jgi:thiamine biosynthesis lipoprotein